MVLVPCFGRLAGLRGSSTGETGRLFNPEGPSRGGWWPPRPWGRSDGPIGPAMCPFGGASLCSLPADEPDSGIDTELSSSLDLEDPPPSPPTTPRRPPPPSTLQASGSFGSSIDILRNIPMAKRRDYNFKNKNVCLSFFFFTWMMVWGPRSCFWFCVRVGSCIVGISKFCPSF